QVMFNVYVAMKHHNEEPECFRVDVVQEMVKDVREEEWDHEIELFLQQLDNGQEEETPKVEEEVIVTEDVKVNPPELKELPPKWKYVCLGGDS
ncbi:hypothetical protein A2U01_0064122, partial [Trifolium medium]|nr:hypothetical protein [Trifolium medium]